MSAARLLIAFAAARVAFGATYLVTSLRSAPLLRYYPVDRRWTFEAHPVGLVMSWYGTTALALVAAAGAFGITWLAGGRGPLARVLRDPRAAVAVARAVGLVLLVDYAYFGWTMTHQTPVPWTTATTPEGDD